MSHPDSRAHRRHHRARVIDKRVKQRPTWFTGLNQPDLERVIARSKGRLADTTAPCSCWMCGNPRRYFGHITLAEHKADLKGREWEGCDILKE